MNTPSLDTWTVIFFLAAVQGLFLGLIIMMHRSRMRKVNQYLGVFILLFSLMLLDYFSYWSNYRYEFPALFGFSFGFPLWYGPVLYFYILELNGISPPKFPIKALHFVPGILFYAYQYDYYLLPADEKLALFGTGQVQTTLQFLTLPLIRIIHMVIYTVLAAQLVRKSWRNDLHDFFRWQRLFIGLFSLYILATTTYYLLVATVDFQVEYDYMISMTMALSIYAIGYLGYRHPQILNGFDSIKSKYERSSLKKDDAHELLAKINHLLEVEKIYQRSDLKMQQVADLLEVSPHHLSQLVNEQLNYSFPDLINSYRVNEIKKKLQDPEFAGEKILGIAFDAGFNNKANFNMAFKKVTGMSPSEYKKLHQLEYMN